MVVLESGPFHGKLPKKKVNPTNVILSLGLLPVLRGWQWGKTGRAVPYGNLGGGRTGFLAWYPLRTTIAPGEVLWSDIQHACKGQDR